MSDLCGNYKRPNAEKRVIEKFVKKFEKSKVQFKNKNYLEALEGFKAGYQLLLDIWDKYPKIITLYYMMKGFFYSKQYDKCKSLFEPLDSMLVYIPKDKNDIFIKIKSKILIYETILYFINDELDNSVDSIIGMIKYLSNHPTFDVEDKAKFFWNYIKSFCKIAGVTNSNKFHLLKEGYNTMIVEQVNVNDENKNNENEYSVPVKKVNRFMMETYKTFMNSKLRGIIYEILDREFYFVKYGKENDKVMVFLHKNINIFVRDNNKERLVDLFHTFIVLNKMDLSKEYNMTLVELVYEQKRRIETFDRIFSNLIGAFNHIFKQYFADELPNLTKKMRRKSTNMKTFKININELKNLIKVRIQSPKDEEDSSEERNKNKKYLFSKKNIKLKSHKEKSHDLKYNFNKEIRIPPNTEAMDKQILIDNYMTRKKLLRYNMDAKYSSLSNRKGATMKNTASNTFKDLSLKLPNISEKRFLRTERHNNISQSKTLNKKKFHLKFLKKKSTESELENTSKITEKKSNDFVLRNINNYLITKILDNFWSIYNIEHNIRSDVEDLSLIYPRKKDIFDFNIPNYISSYGSLSIIGTQQENQDSYFYYNNYFLIKNLTLFGVCDGHGINGKQVSHLVSILFPSYFYYILLDYNLISRKIDINKMILKLMKIQETPDDIKNMFLFRYFFNKFEIEFTEIPFFSKNQNILFNQIHESLHYTHKDLKQRYEIDIDNSGTTLCSGIVFGNTLYIINVGDSRAILGTYYTIYNKWKTTQLSIDHKPKSPNENKRIIACSGRVDKFKNEFGEEYGVYRVFRKEFDSIYPGLAISRSIGDEDAKKLGVVYEPEVFRYELKSQDKILIIGSDGLWEQLSNEEAIKIVGNCMNNNIKSDEAASILVDKAKKKMTNNKSGPKTITINKEEGNDLDLNDSTDEKRKYIDNITCIVIYFDIK